MLIIIIIIIIIITIIIIKKNNNNSNNSNNNNSNNNNHHHLAIGFLILLNKLGLVLLLVNLMFLFKVNASKHKKTIFTWTLFSTFVSCNLLRWLYILLITFSGDVELNSVHKRNAAQAHSICHWNLNSVWAHNLAKSYLLRAYVNVHKFNTICLSETYLDSSVDYGSLEISGYFLIRFGHPSNKKRGGICIYHKNCLPLKFTGVRLLEECIAFNLIRSNKLCSFIAFYRSPSQSQDDFATFSDNFKMTLDLVSKENPFLLVVFGGFNAKLNQWHDKRSSTAVEMQLKRSHHRLHIIHIISLHLHLRIILV